MLIIISTNYTKEYLVSQRHLLNQQHAHTINNEYFEWLKFGELIKFAKLSFANLLKDILSTS